MQIDYPVSLAVAFGLTLFLLLMLRPVATRIGLVDHPGERKLHGGAVPLIGGIAMFIAFCLSVLTLDIPITGLRAFFAGSLILVVIGILDDMHELSARTRFTVQIIATTIMAVWGGVVLNDFGHLLSSEFVFELYWLAVPVTVFAAIGVINALNMLDGVDGLAGFVALVAVIGMAVISFAAGDMNTLMILGLVFSVITAFLIVNLRNDHKQCSMVFMGDSGSMFLGFALSWFLITLSQGDDRAMSPATALWLFAIPLYETLTMIIRRTRNGRSPFSADREHIHHMLELAGYSKRMTVLIIVFASLLFASLGLFGHFYQVPEYVMFYSFIAVFVGYLLLIRRGWKLLNNDYQKSSMREA